MATSPLPVTIWDVRRGITGKPSIRFACPKCGARLTAPAKDGGTVDDCPECKGAFLLPAQPRDQLMQEEIAVQQAKETARKAKGQARQAKALAQREEHRREAQLAKEIKPVVLLQDTRPNKTDGSSGGLGTATGIFFVIVGLILGVVAWIMPVTVKTDVGEVINGHLMNVRQSLLISGGLIFLAGVVMWSAVAVIDGVAKALKATAEDYRRHGPTREYSRPTGTKECEQAALEALGLEEH